MKNSRFILKSFRYLLRYRPWKLLILSCLTLFLGIFQGFSITLLIPFLNLLEIGDPDSSNQLVRMFDSVIEKTGITLSLEVVLMAYVVLLLLIALLNFWKGLYQSKYQEYFSYRVRRRIFRKIILSDWIQLNSKSKHNHLQVLTEEVPKLNVYYYYFLEMLTRIIISGAHIFFAFMISVKFTALVLVFGIIVFVFMRGFITKAFSLGEKQVSTVNRLIKYIDDFWQTVKIAKVHNSEDFYYNKFDDANKDLLDLQYKMTKNYSLPQLIYRIAGIFVLVAVVYIGYQIDKVPLASFFILIVLFGRILPQFVTVNSYLNNIFSYIPAVRLVLNLDEQFGDRDFPEKSKGEKVALEKNIRIENLDFSYSGSEQLFTSFSATIPAHKITGIIGQSGIGKTTLIDLVAGLQKPDKGQIRIDDKILDDKSSSQWKSSIGYLPQDAFFIDGSMRENLVWDRSDPIIDEEICSVLDMVNARHLVDRQKDGLDTIITNYQFSFSGGERQRLALARVMLRKPQILILDEATSSLDSENERVVMELLVGLKESTTIVLVTHRESVIPWCDHIVEK